MMKRSNIKKQIILRGVTIFVGLFLLFLIVILSEFILAIIDFNYSTIPRQVFQPFSDHIIEEMNKNSGRRVFEKDAQLLWRMIPGSRVGVQRVNRDGFLGPVFQSEASMKIACLGDSCTALGLDPYPSRLLNDLKIILGEEGVSVMNAGTPGYSSLQGLRLLRRLYEQKRFNFDIVTINFNWNDHWQALSLEDKEFNQSSYFITTSQNFLNNLRLYQVFLLIFKSHGNPLFHSSELGEEDYHYRVHPDDYYKNIVEIIKFAHNNRIKPLLLTSPLDSEKLDRNNNSTLNKQNMLIHKADEIGIHLRYNQILRDISQKYTVDLIDLEKLFDKSPLPFLFMDDGIHFAHVGSQLVSDTIMQYFEQNLIIPQDSLIKVTEGRTFTSYGPHIMRADITLSPSQYVGKKGDKSVSVALSIVNSGDTIWNRLSPYPIGFVRVGCSLMDANLNIITRDYDRFPLPYDCSPGMSIEMPIRVKLPDSTGKFYIDFDLVNEGVGWFKKWDSKTSKLNVILKNS